MYAGEACAQRQATREYGKRRLRRVCTACPPFLSSLLDPTPPHALQVRLADMETADGCPGKYTVGLDQVGPTERGVERTEVKLGIEPGAHDDPITYQRLTK